MNFVRKLYQLHYSIPIILHCKNSSRAAFFFCASPKVHFKMLVLVYGTLIMSHSLVFPKSVPNKLQFAFLFFRFRKIAASFLKAAMTLSIYTLTGYFVIADYVPLICFPISVGYMPKSYCVSGAQLHVLCYVFELLSLLAMYLVCAGN